MCAIPENISRDVLVIGRLVCCLQYDSDACGELRDAQRLEPVYTAKLYCCSFSTTTSQAYNSSSTEHPLYACEQLRDGECLQSDCTAGQSVSKHHKLTAATPAKGGLYACEKQRDASNALLILQCQKTASLLSPDSIPCMSFNTRQASAAHVVGVCKQRSCTSLTEHSWRCPLP